MKTTTTIRSMMFAAMLLFSQLNFTIAQDKIIGVTNQAIITDKILVDPNCADLAVESININSVSGNSINFSFTVKNISLSWLDSIHLNRMYFQAYVSKDHIYDATDVPAGGSIFGNNAPTLASYDTYERSWTSNPNADLTEYKYVIVQVKVRSGYSQPECGLANNTGFKNIGCAIAELVVMPLVINSVNGNSVNFTYTVKNTGWGTLHLDRMYFQAYVSKDYVLDATDKPAGGSILGNNAPALAKDGTYSGTWTSNPAVSLTEYPILIIEFKERFGYSMPECNQVNRASKYIGCNLAELTVNNITINSVTGNSCNFTYTLKNTGWGTLNLSKFYFQAYVSQDHIYDASDKPAGGSILGNNAPDLAKDETFSGTWTSNPAVSLTNYPYIIIQFRLRPGETQAECNTNNNSGYRYIGCNLAELTINNIVINSVIGNSVNFTYTVKNTGWGPLYLDRMYFQTYVSKDNVYDFTDKPAGGSIIGTNAPALAKGETYSGTWTSNSSVDVSVYKYLIIQFKVRYGYEMPECNTVNNSTYKLIPAQTYTFDQFEFDFNAFAGFRVSTTTGNNSISITAGEETSVTYKIYSVDARFNGQILSEGTSKGSQEISLFGFKPGLYILHATDGIETYSEKFMINE